MQQQETQFLDLLQNNTKWFPLKKQLRILLIYLNTGVLLHPSLFYASRNWWRNKIEVQLPLHCAKSKPIHVARATHRIATLISHLLPKTTSKIQQSKPVNAQEQTPLADLILKSESRQHFVQYITFLQKQNLNLTPSPTLPRPSPPLTLSFPQMLNTYFSSKALDLPLPLDILCFLDSQGHIPAAQETKSTTVSDLDQAVQDLRNFKNGILKQYQLLLCFPEILYQFYDPQSFSTTASSTSLRASRNNKGKRFGRAERKDKKQKQQQRQTPPPFVFSFMDDNRISSSDSLQVIPFDQITKVQATLHCYYDTQVLWVPGVYAYDSLPFFAAACNYVTTFGTFIQLTPLLNKENAEETRKKKSRLSWASWLIYENRQFYDLNRSELILHELVHASRHSLHSERFEEEFAYQFSKSWYKRYFSPITQKPSDSFLFTFVSLFSILDDLQVTRRVSNQRRTASSKSTNGSNIHQGKGNNTKSADLPRSKLEMIMSKVIFKMPFFMVIILGIIRLLLTKRQLRRAKNLLSRTGVQQKNIQPILFRLTDAELVHLSQQRWSSKQELIAWVLSDKISKKELKWFVLLHKYIQPAAS